MFDILKKDKVILREERCLSDYRYLGVEINKNGDLVFEGQDIGSMVETAFGHTEYEWNWTIKVQDIPKFQDAIGEDGNILEVLKKNFSDEKAAGISLFMTENHIPFTSWSRIGD